MNKTEAKAHFLATLQFFFEEEGIQKDETHSIEDWSVFIAEYLSLRLRGRTNVDPEHKIFRIKFD